mgnify:CR=1 FL=1
MKNKKIFVLLCTTILLTVSFFSSAVNASTMLKIENPTKTDEIFTESLENESDEVHWETGLLKISTKGKGLFLLAPLRLFRLNVPIITPQYDRFLPFRIDNFVTLLVYNDENASTKIEQEGKETIYINGSHSILMGMFKIQFLHLLRIFLEDGIIDGFQRFQKPSEYGSKGPIAKVISKLINKTLGGPVFDVTSETYEFFDYLKGTPPRYDLQKPIFNISGFNEIRDKLPWMLLFYIRLFGFMYPTQMFWNRMPIRTSFLQFKQTMKCYGYSPFVRWTTDPKLQPFVGKVQDAIPDIIYDEPEEFKEY